MLDKTDLSVEHELLASVSEPLSFVNGCKLILGSLRPSITSLKLRKIPVCRYPYNGGRILLAAFRHLDLELYTQTFWDNRSEPVRLASVDAWRCSLAPLEQLRTLRLGGWKQWNNPIIPFYIDDLLIDRKDDANVSFLPHLKHLFFSDCFLRMQGLAIATSHASILQELELSRVTYDPSYCPQAWSEIGLLCKSALPILAYLRLAKTVTHFPRRATAPLDEMPIPERWNKGLKGVTSYEWRKGVHNPDVEVIGSRCPWKVEDIIVEEDCKRNFGGDRYLCSVEKERILEA